MDRVVNMECRSCGKRGDDIQDFINPGIVGKRICPRCGSGECYILQSKEPKHD